MGFHTTLEGPINCLSVNRDCAQVVVAGRNVFKVFIIEDSEFAERVNLRVGNFFDLNYSASDVAWNPSDDSILASASTNGAVVTWNLGKATRSKQEHVYQDFERAVNRVCFHSHETHLLLGGSHDGTMKIFDLRKPESSTTFSGKSESVRDVQFCPHQYFQFAAAYENGNVQIWDMRSPKQCEREFTTHNGPVFCLDYHPDEKNSIATAGRDKMIKVWDLTKAGIRNTHTIQTIASVNRIKWRPQRPNQIASCSLLLDFNINVWDVRRPYIPFAAFSEHRDVVTGIAWKPHDPHTFFSGGKDGELYQHEFREATRPADRANPVGVDLSIHGDLVHASSDKLVPNLAKSGSYSATKLPSFFRKMPDKSEQFTVVHSLFSEFNNCGNVLSMDWLRESAVRYRLTGYPMEELLEHNASVATYLGRHQVAQSWRMLKVVYSTEQSKLTKALKQLTALHSSKLDIHSSKDLDTEHGKSVGDSKSLQERKMSDSEDVADTSTGVSDDETGEEDIQGEKEDDLLNIASGLGNNSHSDFFFGDTDADNVQYDFDTHSTMQNGQDWNLPSEAFQPRMDLADNAASSDVLNHSGAVDSPSSANESEFSSSVQPALDSQVPSELLSVPTFISQIPEWNFSTIVCDMLRYYAEQGDVQMSVTVLIILGDKLNCQIAVSTLEHWFLSYIELLGRFRLWSVATQVIQLSAQSNVSCLSQQSTVYHTNCSACRKPMHRAGWVCDKCKSIAVCCICHQVVKGLYSWCQGCAHGGHLQHMREWQAKSRYCPTGCGHRCEYT